MPDLDLIKQGEQGCGTGASGSPQDGRAIPAAGRATGGRHLCSGDRDQRFRTAFAAGRGRSRQPRGVPPGTNGGGPNWFYNPEAIFCCRFTADGGARNNRLNS